MDQAPWFWVSGPRIKSGGMLFFAGITRRSDTLRFVAGIGGSGPVEPGMWMIQ